MDVLKAYFNKQNLSKDQNNRTINIYIYIGLGRTAWFLAYQSLIIKTISLRKTLKKFPISLYKKNQNYLIVSQS